MTRTDMDRVQAYLRRLLGSDRLNVLTPARPGLSVELAVDEEVIGTIYEDRDEGELSYSINITVLEEDLPPAPASRPAPSGAAARGRRS